MGAARDPVWTPKVIIRDVLIASALAAIVLGGLEEYVRTEPWRERCRHRAEKLASLSKALFEFSDPSYIDELEAKGLARAKVAALRAEVRSHRELAELCVRLRKKWLVGTWLPWIEITPDPPGVPQSHDVYRWEVDRP